MSRTCLIVGGGIAGTAAALALSKIGISCTIYELRAIPATIGGAVNLTPNALRLLEDLDVEVFGCPVDAIEIFSLDTGRKLGEIPFRKSGHALRVVREDLQNALLSAVEKAGIPIIYSSKLVSLYDQNDASKVTAIFSNGPKAQADFILGCDGMHSAVRTKHVEPDRTSIYTGIAVAYSIVNTIGMKSNVHFHETAVNSGRYGSLLTSYIDFERTKIYLAAVMETPKQESKEGWKTRGKDREKTLSEINRRYKDSDLPCLAEFIERADDFILFPVYNLGPGGEWMKGRVLLLGDAAHGVCWPFLSVVNQADQ